MLNINNLRCENQIDPLCIDADPPHLSWTLFSTERAKRQTAYHILVASSPELLVGNCGDLWDSGRVESSQTAQIEYAGVAMASFRRHFWKVCVWDEEQCVSDWSQVAEWAAGVLQPNDWAGDWITCGRGRTTPSSGPLPRFRNVFEVKKPVTRAVLYSSGVGFHEMYLNGEKVGDEVLSPLWTNYRKTVFYVAHDITERLQQGDNVLAAELGNGFFNVAGGRYVKYIGCFGPLTLRGMIRMEHTDGSVSFVGTTPEWKSNTGPIVFSCIYGGEDYDARLEQSGWNDVGFDDTEWNGSGYDSAGAGVGGVLRAQAAAPVKVMERFPAVVRTRPGVDVAIYDFSRNFAGWPCIRVRGKAGASVRLKIAECLDEEGRLFPASVLGLSDENIPGIEFAYTLKGGGIEEWHPRFSYSGFRYAEARVEGEVEILSLEGQFVHSSTDRAGSFSCSKGIFNRINGLVDNAVRSNFQSVLTDCPHREKLGWMEAPCLMGPSILYNYDAELFFKKIIQDAVEAQLDDGLIPNIAPEYTVFGGIFRDSPEWGSSVVLIPWMLYRWRGDLRVLRDHYAAMVRYVDYLRSVANDGIVGYGLGDWHDLSPDPGGRSTLTPEGVTATAFYYRNLKIMEQIADLLGHTADMEYYAKLAVHVYYRFNQLYFDSGGKYYATGSQVAQAIPLVFGLVPGEHRDGVVSQMISDIESRGDQPTAGDIGYRFLIRALADASRSDLLYRMNVRTNNPSYGFLLINGATTLTEAWDADPYKSQNHCMLGHIQEWFLSGLAGIGQEKDSVGFEKIVIKPDVPEGLDWVSAHYDSIYGRIESEWKVKGQEFVLRVQIPANCTARIFIPAKAETVQEAGVSVENSEGITAVEKFKGGCIISVGSGEYHFKTAALKSASNQEGNFAVNNMVEEVSQLDESNNCVGIP